MRKVAVMAAALAVCCTALAQENGGAKSKGKAPEAGRGYRPPASLLASCPVMSRIKLSKVQLRKIGKLEEENNKEVAKAFKKTVGNGGNWAKYYTTRRQLIAGLRKKIVALFDDSQKKKYEAGSAVFADFRAKTAKLRKEHFKALRRAGKDKAKTDELKAKYQENVKPLREEMDKQLDEKVGKRPERPEKKAAQ